MNNAEVNYNFITEFLLNNPFEGVVIIDDATRIVFINEFFLNILKQNKENVMGRSLNEIMPEMGTKEKINVDYSCWGEFYRINGKPLYLSSYPIKNNGNFAGRIIKTLFPEMYIANCVADKINQKKILFKNNKAVFTCSDLIGETPCMLDVKRLARRASRSNSNLLITGASGTGKGVVAQAIHNRSLRREGPFITVNCAAIPENLLEAEMFGFEDGSFTGARKGGKPGKFELAEGGTIFLDEIGEISFNMQAKLLHVLQTKEFDRIGSTKSKKVDVRIITATNCDLEDLVGKKLFRNDLYYRLKVLEINLPPLRERIEDLPLLIASIIKKLNQKMGADAKGVSMYTLETLKSYNWPGNIRELENIIEKMINWSDEDILEIDKIPGVFFNDIKPQNIEAKSLNFKSNTFSERVNEVEESVIYEALKRNKGNKSLTARELNISRSVLYSKLQKYKINL
jgi:transcriptional regulator with PAS, ATPase and Fis domain